ncbi:DNA-binding transcriptional regulator, MerR family [Promicromonospora umidemergens]|uniref:MerR family transcriptional regulator n=1 Tax=Promicromonospora umidemergens TaxID=629679 RepID=A0ABP8XF01_9MICO|nr:MerR family transcriptional regulator [Promicromonospora umidemergens]MCP2283110.1 DNA-binding transcriptional regulator, MerR family [Promicromonospora umidemergens]
MKSISVSEDQSVWSVGDLAARFGLETHVLRHWESMGLLSPARDGGGRRRYGTDDAFRVATILRSKAAGMSLEQIRVLLDGGAYDRHVILEAHIADLEQRMADMELSRDMARHALECRAHDITACPNFRSHVQDIVDGKIGQGPSLVESLRIGSSGFGR